MKIKIFAFALPVLLFLSGCTVDYTHSAVEKARSFALKNTLDLTEYQRNHIRYVYPAVWKREIFTHKPMSLTEYDHMARNRDFKPRKSDRLHYMDMSFAWENIPGLGYTVIVLGHGENSGNFWEPLKVVYKKSAPVDPGYENAKAAAVNFVTNNMLDLSTQERNRVRFSEAQVAYTSFDLSYAQEEKPFVRKKRETGLEGYLASLRKDAAGKRGKTPGAGGGETQFSLVWKGDDPGKLIVISGISPNNSLGTWKILSGAVLTVKVFERFLQERLYLSPADMKAGKLVPDKEATVHPYRKSSAGEMKKEKRP